MNKNLLHRGREVQGGREVQADQADQGYHRYQEDQQDPAEPQKGRLSEGSGFDWVNLKSHDSCGSDETTPAWEH